MISIHTPTKGVTSHRIRHKVTSAISIHTPTKGVTNISQDKRGVKKYFNPHSHEGSDSKRNTIQTIRYNFNPHSHEGSDFYIGTTKPTKGDFNPHSHEGSDTAGKSFVERQQTFQSTLPRRE